MLKGLVGPTLIHQVISFLCSRVFSDVGINVGIVDLVVQVLGTDMAQHFHHLAEFRSVVDSLKPSTADSGGASHKMNYVGRTSSGGHSDKMGFSDMDQKVLMCAVVHLADMGNPTKPWEICKEWTFSLLKEFFRQVFCCAAHVSWHRHHDERSSVAIYCEDHTTHLVSLM
jgi:hypothetical protein